MTTSMMPDDRRSLTLRLSFMQYSVALVFAVLAVAFWIFQIAQHDHSDPAHCTCSSLPHSMR